MWPKTPPANDPGNNGPATQPPPAGALPEASEGFDFDRIWRAIRRNKLGVSVTLVFMFVILALAFYFATRSLTVAPVVQPSAAPVPDIAVTPGQHNAGNTPAYTPVPNGTTDANGQNAAQLTVPPETPPPGIDPVEWQRYRAFRITQIQQQQNAANTTAGGATTSGGAQQQRQLTPAETRAEELRKKQADLLWNARLALPSTGAHAKTSAATSPATPDASASSSSTDPSLTGTDAEIARLRREAADQAARLSGNERDRTRPQPDPETHNEPLVTHNSCGPAHHDPTMLVAGISLVKARIFNAITSEAAGPLLAEVVQPTYSFRLDKLVIPKGAYVKGNYARVAEVDQERVLVAVDEIMMPDGCQIQFKSVDVLDQSGMAGLTDKVNHHYGQLFLTSLLTAGIGAAAQFGGSSSGYGASPVDVLRIGFGAGASQVAQQAYHRWGNRPATITVRAGQVLTFFLPADVTVGVWGDHVPRTDL